MSQKERLGERPSSRSWNEFSAIAAHHGTSSGRWATVEGEIGKSLGPGLPLADWLGLLRSVLIYRAIPFRARRWGGFYAALLRPGELAFDIGAHVGNRLGAMRRAGARVVALEPQPVMARYLRRAYGTDPAVTLLPYAVGDSPGRQTMMLSRRTPTVSTLSTSWMEAVGRDPSFRAVVWDRTAEVIVTTLDLLIEEFGLPAFCKIDAEGSEPDILRGLSQPLPGLAFEFLPAAIDHALECIGRLEQLGIYKYNWTLGENSRFGWTEWGSPQEVRAFLAAIRRGSKSGDIYARQALP